ncbi:hypothetical protein [Scytonema sp. PRP1]|uniref:hypothetical protein n=1 Tax=Scytonema sp. PRP1 TaxID=3120513 RepID=UPI002FD45F7D
MAFNTLVFSSLLALQILPPLPSEDNANRIVFLGNVFENEGNLGFSSLDPSARDYGHIEISKTAEKGVNTSYYITGREGSPEPFNQAVRSASAIGISGYTNFSKFLSSNGITLKDIGFGFSPKGDLSVTKTWNLGNDILGKDWYGSPDSPVEELIYRANPDDVDISLFYKETKIVDFSYSDIFGAIDGGTTTLFDDNNFLLFTNPITATKEPGLEQLEDSFADAFLRDITDVDGKVRIIWNNAGAPVPLDLITTDQYRVQYFTLPISIQPLVKAIPEPSYVVGLLALGFMGRVFLQKRTESRKNFL